jgi:hypothetical protein
MFSINARRLLIFASIVILIGLLVQQNWASKTPDEKWLYLFKYSAQQYANKVLGTARGTHVPVPEELSGNNVEIQERYVVYSPKQSPDLVLAFAPVVKPPARDGKDWRSLGDSWYMLQAPAPP